MNEPAMVYRLNRALLLIVIAIGTIGVTPAPTVNAVSTISINVEWLGLPGATAEYHGTIVRKGNAFLSAGRIVPRKRMATLLAALERPVRKSAIASDFGASAAWLDSNAEQAFKSYVLDGDGDGEGFFTHDQEVLFVRSFESPNVVSAALAKYYARLKWTDDDIDVAVTISLKDGRALRISSTSQRTLMLPWFVDAGALKYETFDPAISDAVAALLPADAIDNVIRYGRLSHAQLAKELPGIVGAEIQPLWNTIPKFAVQPLVLDLERRYGVRITFAQDADLSWDDLPANVSATVTLPVVNNAITNTETIPDAKQFAKEALAIPWIGQVLSQHPEVTMSVLIENDSGSSISAANQEEFLADLKAMNRSDLASSVRGSLSQAFVVMFNEPKTFSEWVILPDHHAVLWLYDDSGSDLPILGLSAAVLGGKQCPKRDFLCSGLLREPDGGIANGLR